MIFNLDIVVNAKTSMSIRRIKAAVGSCHMVWNDVDDYFESLLMTPSDQVFEFSHSVRRIICQIRIYIKIILNGIR